MPWRCPWPRPTPTVQPPEVHPAPALRLPGPQDLPQDRLPRPGRPPGRPLGPPRRSSAWPPSPTSPPSRRPAAGSWPRPPPAACSAATVRRFLSRRRRVRRVALDSTGLDVRARQPVLRPPPERGRKGLADRGLQPVRQAGGGVRLRHPPARRRPWSAAGRGWTPTGSCPCWTPPWRTSGRGRPWPTPGTTRRPTTVHAREARGVKSFIPATIGRPTCQAAGRAVPAADEAAAGQGLRPVRAAVAGRDRVLDVQAAARDRAWPAGPIGASAGTCCSWPSPTTSCSSARFARFSTEQVGSLY